MKVWVGIAQSALSELVRIRELLEQLLEAQR